MKIIHAALLLAGVTVAGFSQSAVPKQTGDAKLPFKLEITANLEKGHSNAWDFENSAGTVVKAGSMVVIAIRKANISDREINRRTMAGQAIDVSDSSGDPVAHKKRDAMQGSVWGMRPSGQPEMLQPSENKIDRELVSDGFDLRQPGMYTIRISEHISDDPASDVVKSNAITVTVLPADGPTAGAALSPGARLDVDVPK